LLELQSKVDFTIPCILYNGVGNWTAARSFREYLDEGDLFEKYTIDFRYILIDINRLSDMELAKQLLKEE
jgi:hypothetical protein